MWWYRDQKNDDEEDGAAPSSPAEIAAAILGRVLNGRPKEPDRLTAMALLVGGNITLESGDVIGTLSSTEAEQVIDAACGEPQRLYNAYSRSFGEGVPDSHRACLDELIAAVTAVEGVQSCTFG